MAVWRDSAETERGLWRRLSRFALHNAVPLVPFLYGLRCLVTLQGFLTEPGTHVMGSFVWAPVSGAAAALTGVGDMAIGLFGYLSCGPSPDRVCPWPGRVLREVVRWGSLAVTYWCWHRAHEIRLAGL
jgi:hypothetical protein